MGRNVGEPDFTTGQVTIGTAPTKIVGERSNRRSILVIQHGTNAVYLGKHRTDLALTTTNGVLLVGNAGTGLSIPTTDEVWGVAGAEQLISYIEIY